MGHESREALSQISEIRGGSWEDARQFCAKIQSYQGRQKSSYVDIAEVLAWLEREGRPYSNRELAEEAEQITLAKRPERNKTEEDVSSLEIVIDHPGIKKFEGRSEHQDFIDWIDHNSNEGFVLNLKGRNSDPIMHSANCSHLSPNPKKDRVATAHVKLCSVVKKALRRKALKLAEEQVELCQHCDV